MHEGFFFGPPNRQIFGAYHPPVGGAGGALTVICAPLFSEYLRTHAALRALAVALSQAGQHVLRFDYLGTGDSAGELEQIEAADWLEDIALAVDEGREISGSSALQLLCVRAGALLACRSLNATRGARRIVLWDPVADGAAYVQALRHEQAAVCARNPHLDPAERCAAMREYAGYTLSERMAEKLGSFGADTYAHVPAGLLHVVSTAPNLGFPVSDVLREEIAFRCNWDELGVDQLVPRPVMEGLVRCLVRP